MEPPDPPPSLLDWLRLARAPGIGPVLAGQLLARFGSPGAVFAASRRELDALPGMGSGRVDALLDPRLPDHARREADRAAAIGVRFLCLADSSYPVALRSLTAPPLVLSLRGRLVGPDRLALTIVGPRMASEYARRMTRRLVPPLSARGLTIVSGLAQGIDAEAHAAALRSDGRTVAFLGQGLDCPLHPASNRDLADRMIEEGLGALVSAFPLAMRPQASLYPQRNELLAAFSLGVLVIEAGERSGALITARHALELGRPVLTCPADADRASARGSNRLLADGAALVQTSDDVLDAMRSEIRRELVALGFDPAVADGPIPAGLRADSPGSPPHGRPEAPSSAAPSTAADTIRDPLTRAIDGMLREEHRPIDFILQGCADAGFGHAAVVQRLLELELSGRLRQLPGRIYARAE